MYALSETEQRAIIAQICTPKEREAWELIEIQGRSIRHASHELKISVGSTKDRIAGARAKVKRHLQDALPTPANESNYREPPPRTSDEQLAISLLIERDGDHCYLCHKRPRPGTYVVEHIIPRSAGGTSDATNLALACASCNGRKSSRIVSLLVTSRRPVYHVSQRTAE